MYGGPPGSTPFPFLTAIGTLESPGPLGVSTRETENRITVGTGFIGIAEVHPGTTLRKAIVVFTHVATIRAPTLPPGAILTRRPFRLPVAQSSLGA